LGAPVHLRQLDRHLALPRHAAPLYPFERTPFWFERPATSHLPAALPATSDWPGRRVELALDGVACFETSLPDAASAYLLDHSVFGQSIMPAAGYLALAREAAKAIGLAQVSLTDIHFLHALPLANDAVRLQTVLSRETDGRWALQIATRRGRGDWQLHVRGALNRLDAPPVQTAPASPASFPSAGASAGMADFYALWAGRGLAYGPCFQAVQAVCSGHGVIHGRVSLPRGVSMSAGQILHPVLLDGAFQLIGHALQDMAAVATQVPVPVALEEIITHTSQAAASWLVTATLRAGTGPASIVADLAVYDSAGQPIARIRGLMLRWIDSAVIAPPVRQLIPQRRQWQQIPGAADAAAPRCWRQLQLRLKSCPQFTGLQEPSFPVIDSGQLTVSGDDTVVWEGMDVTLAGLPAGGGVIVQLPLLDSDRPVATSIAACRALQQLIVMLDGYGKLPDGFSLCVLTSGATGPLPGDTEVSVAAAGVTGLLKSASLEYPHLRLRHLDLPVRPDGADRAALAHALALNGEMSSAIRDGVVYAPRLQPLADSAEASLPLLLDAAGVYLVTGGAGALGLHVAEWLAASGANHIVLASRQAQPGPHG
ncbi:MAG: polyketide synthase dehydratase domain-containing protein, partial [Herbaspirillum sp.]